MAKATRRRERKPNERCTLFTLSLRDDFSQLILKGLRQTGLKQRQLAEAAGCEESYISRFVNVTSDFKSGTAAKVLEALDIWPVLVDKADLDRLIELDRRNIEHAEAQETNTAGSGATVLAAAVCDTGAISNHEFSRLADRVAVATGCETGTADSLGGSRSLRGVSIIRHQRRSALHHFVLPQG